jgi:predicted Zn finger-like uncharacterized protein
MYTRCPYCQTYFKIHAEHLKRAKGKVRCGQCYKVFNSLGNLLEDLPVPLSQNQPGNKTTTHRTLRPKPPSTKAIRATLVQPASTEFRTGRTGTSRSYRSVASEASADVAVGRTATRPRIKAELLRRKQPASRKFPFSSQQDDSLNLSRKDQISDVQTGVNSTARELIVHPSVQQRIPPKEKKTGGLSSLLGWSIGLFLLLFFFLVQYSYFLRDDLAKHKELRPWIETICKFAHCNLPLQKDIRLIELTHREISVHPRVKNALLISAIMLNNATFAQPFPIMRIQLSDTAGTLIASRNFTPSEYLDADVNTRDGMPPGQPVQIMLEIADPGTDAVNFEFDFFHED